MRLLRALLLLAFLAPMGFGALASTTNRVDYTGSGSTGPFPVPFAFMVASDLRVSEQDTGGTVTTLTYPADYSVIGGGNATGSLTLTVALTSGWRLTIDRGNMPQTQPVSLPNQGPFIAKTHETEFDRLTMLAQQLGNDRDRSLRFPATETSNSILPAAPLRANNWLAFDADGNPIAVAGSAPALADTVYSVASFHPVRDGVTNDSAVIQAAITAASSAGSRLVYLPAGRYGVGSQITVPSGITIRGDGMGKTVLVVLNSLGLTSAVFQNTNAPTVGARIDSNIAFERFSIDGTGRVYTLYLTDPATGLPIANPAVNLTRNPNYATRGAVIKMNGVDGLTFREVEVYGQMSHGLMDQGGRDVLFKDCRFHGCGKVDDISSPIYSQSFGSLRVITNVTKANPAVVTLDGSMIFSNGDSIKVEGVRGLAHVPDGTYVVAGISGTTFQLSGIDTSSDSGFVSTNESIATPTNFVGSQDVNIVDCDFRDNHRSAITMSPTYGGSVRGCTFRNNGESTIFSSRSRQLVIAGNRFIRNNLTDIAASLIEASNAADITISNNHFEESDCYGITLQAAIGASITGNKFRNIIRNGSLTFPYGPLAEDWTGSTQGPGNQAGAAVGKKAYICLSSLSGQPCSDVLVAHNTFIDDRNTPLTTNGVSLQKSGTNSIVYDISVVDNDFIKSGLIDANMVIAPSSNTVLEYTIGMRGNLGHSSENPKQIAGSFAAATTGVQTLAFGFVPRTVYLKVWEDSGVNVRVCESWVARDRVNILNGTLGNGMVFGLDAVETAPQVDQSTVTTHAWRLKDGTGTVKSQAEFQAWDLTGMKINIVTATDTIKYVAIGFP